MATPTTSRHSRTAVQSLWPRQARAREIPNEPNGTSAACAFVQAQQKLENRLNKRGQLSTSNGMSMVPAQTGRARETTRHQVEHRGKQRQAMRATHLPRLISKALIARAARLAASLTAGTCHQPACEAGRLRRNVTGADCMQPSTRRGTRGGHSYRRAGLAAGRAPLGGSSIRSCAVRERESAADQPAISPPGGKSTSSKCPRYIFEVPELPNVGIPHCCYCC